jgi:membrane-associated phospholipid phosphatase
VTGNKPLSWEHRLAVGISQLELPRGFETLAGLGSLLGDRGALWLALALAYAGMRGGLGRIMLRLALVALYMLGPNRVAKAWVRRARPYHVAGVARRGLARRPSDPAFPSGHVATATACALCLRRAGVDARILALLVGGVALSRILSLDHFPSDVAAGMVSGLLAYWVTTRLERTLEELGVLGPARPRSEQVLLRAGSVRGPNLFVRL